MAKAAKPISEYDKPGNGSDRALTGGVQDRIAQIRADIGELTESVTRTGSAAAADVKNHAGAISSDVTRASEETVAELTRQLDALERDARGRIRENPLTAIGIAAGIGFLAALVMRR